LALAIAVALVAGGGAADSAPSRSTPAQSTPELLGAPARDPGLFEAERVLGASGPVQVRTSARSIVVAAAAVEPGLVARVARTADASAGDVDHAWGTGWPRRTVVLLPATLDQAAALLGRPSTAGLDRMAAYALGEVGVPAGAEDARIVVLAGALAALTGVGQRVVLSHELVHVATRTGARFTPPLWLQEGFADHVAFAGSGLSPRAVVGDALDGVRLGARPAALPDAAAFDPARGDPAPAYAQAWLACEVLAGLTGPGGGSVDRSAATARLAAIYRVAAGVDGGSRTAQQALAAAFAAAGTDQATLLAAWRHRLLEVTALRTGR
jgi:hypothetical protein